MLIVRYNAMLCHNTFKRLYQPSFIYLTAFICSWLHITIPYNIRLNGRYVNLRYVIVYVVHVCYVTLSFITLCYIFFPAFFISFLFDGKDLDGNLIWWTLSQNPSNHFNHAQVFKSVIMCNKCHIVSRFIYLFNTCRNSVKTWFIYHFLCYLIF